MIKKIIKKMVPNSLKLKARKYMLNKVKSDLKNTEVRYELSFSEKGKLNEKIALVTGASGAIGSAIAFRLAAEGATVIACGRNLDNLKSVEKQVKNNGGKIHLYSLDVTDNEEIERVFDEVKEKFGSIDILVNNAGGGARGKSDYIYAQSIEIINDIIQVNLMGTIYCSRKAASIMVSKKRGKIINIGSTVGVQGLSKYSEYAAAKAGVIGFTKSIAMELGKFNINVNCVSPGIVDHVMFDKDVPPTATKTSYIERLGKTDDIANTVAFLASDEANYITGQNILVDGGRTLGLKGS